MRNSMIIDHGFNITEHCICACRDCKIKSYNEPISTFYSYKHAIDSGWIHTKEVKYCAPDRVEGAWVCPSCYKEKIMFIVKEGQYWINKRSKNEWYVDSVCKDEIIIIPGSATIRLQTRRIPANIFQKNFDRI